MAIRRFPFLNLTLVSVVAGAALGGFNALSASSETLLRDSFAKALSPQQLSARRTVASKAPVAASEADWLAALRNDAVTPVSRTVSLGDTITLALGGKERKFRVSSVSEFATQKTEVKTGVGDARLVLITANDMADPSSKPVRFVMEVEGGTATIAGIAPDKTL